MATEVSYTSHKALAIGRSTIQLSNACTAMTTSLCLALAFPRLAGAAIKVVLTQNLQLMVN